MQKRETPIGQGAASGGSANVSPLPLNNPDVECNFQPTRAEVLAQADRALAVCKEDVWKIDIQRRRLKSNLSDLDEMRGIIVEQEVAIKALKEDLLFRSERWRA